MNWVDIAIVLLLIFYGYRGWRRGFLSMALSLGTLAVSVGAAVLVYRPLGRILHSGGASEAAARAAAFLGVWVLVAAVTAILGARWYRKLPESTVKSDANRVAGILPGLVDGAILIAFVALFFVAAPVSLPLKDSVTHSAIAKPLVARAADVQKSASYVFGEAIQGALDFVTVRPEMDSKDSLDLKFKTTDVVVDTEAENRMLEMVNEERTSRGLKPLVMDAKLRQLARAHSRDMFAKGYFSHVTPSGVNPFQRMRKAGIHFGTAGENLALAPNVEVAHRGLMKSPGHRENILSPEFGRVGIGAVENKVRGVMFSQEFTD